MLAWATARSSAGIETCVTVLAADGNEEITAFQVVGLIESLLLIGSIAAATQACGSI